MANELTLVGGATFSDSNGSASISTVGVTVTSADMAKVSGQTATTTAASLTFPSASGRIGGAIKNEDAAINLLVSLDAGVTFPVSIPPGGVFSFYLASGSADVKVKSASATLTYEYLTA